MSNILVLGAQWGDEGKGKITDLLAEKMDMVVRFQGGANAGHTLVVGGEKTVLHQLPSGVLNPRCHNVIGNGCVIDLEKLVEEIEFFQNRKISLSPKNLMVSEKVHVVTPIHRLIDGWSGKTIGTTGRGIGPCYAEKANRTGIRLEDMFSGTYKRKLSEQKKTLSSKIPGSTTRSFSGLSKSINAMEKAAGFLKPYAGNTAHLIFSGIQKGKKVLLEGAQGALLDIDHGTYPYVTSSNTTIGGAYSGTGVFIDFDLRIAVAKAFQTRVGMGPFPTELKDRVGNRLRSVGKEFGATTGRPRRCGWLDLELLRESFIMNGFNYLALTKLDVLSGLEKIKVSIGRTSAGLPSYKEFDGWTEDISEITEYRALPKNSRNYISFLENFIKISAGLISVGPDRHQNIIREKIW